MSLIAYLVASWVVFPCVETTVRLVSSPVLMWAVERNWPMKIETQAYMYCLYDVRSGEKKKEDGKPIEGFLQK